MPARFVVNQDLLRRDLDLPPGISDIFERHNRDLMHKVAAGKARNPLPPGYVWRDEFSSEETPAGNYRITVTSTPIPVPA